MKKLELSEIQQIEYQLAIEIDRVCRENKINYFLMYGSLLGAIRHKGFIPWDDDIDFVMDRKNYNLLIDALNKINRPDRFVQNTELDKNFEIPMTRYCMKNTFCYAPERKKIKCHKYIYVDILPLDNLPDDNFEAQQFIKKVKKLKLVLYYKMNYKYGHRTIFGYLKAFLYWLCLLPISKRKLIKKIENLMAKYKNITTKRIINFNTAYNYLKDTYNVSDYYPSRECEFLNSKFYCPNNTDAILKQLYNEYMVLPPVEKRVIRHDCYMLEPGDVNYEKIQ